MSSSQNTVKETDIEANKAAQPHRIQTYFESIVDNKKCNPISIYGCFLVGFTSAMSFSACFIWCGFQTGNVAQLGIAAARTFDPYGERTYHFEKPDQQALTSVLSFLIGTSLGRVGDKIGAKTRTWLVTATFMQCLMVMAAALLVHYSGESPYAGSRHNPSWTTPKGMACLGFLSASLGLQGIMGKRIASPMNTTVVLTTTWVEIFNDPLLFSLKPVKSRDIRVMGVLALFFGGFVSRAITNACGSAAGALGVLAALRVVQLVWWIMIPNPPAGP